MPSHPVWILGLIDLFYNQWRTQWQAPGTSGVTLVPPPRPPLLIFAIAQVYVAPMDNTGFSLIRPMIYGYKQPEKAPRQTERSKGIPDDRSLYYSGFCPPKGISGSL